MTAIPVPTHGIAVEQEDAVRVAVVLHIQVERVHTIQIGISL